MDIIKSRCFLFIIRTSIAAGIFVYNGKYSDSFEGWFFISWLSKVICVNFSKNASLIC